MKIKPQELEDIVKGSSITWSSRLNAYMWKPPKGGHTLSGKNQRGDGSQKENQEPLLWIKVPLFLYGSKSSPWIIEDNKDGIRFYADNWGMEHVRFKNSGEDCVTSYATKGIINNCIFYGDENADKCLQLNVADKALVSNCKFYNFIRAIQFGLKKYSARNHSATATNNLFENCSTAILAVEMKLEESGNILNGAKIIRQ